MATSEAEVCNIALLRVGIRRTLDDLDEDSIEAMACSSLFPTARDAILEEFDWPFARRRFALAAITDAERDGWGFVYALPSDCIAPRWIWSGLRAPAVDQRIPFDWEDDPDDGRVLLCDLESASLTYTARATTVEKFTPLFQQALAWHLAADLALALPVKPQVGLRMQQGYEAALAKAIASAARQHTPDVPPESSFVRERE